MRVFVLDGLSALFTHIDHRPNFIFSGPYFYWEPFKAHFIGAELPAQIVIRLCLPVNEA